MNQQGRKCPRTVARTLAQEEYVCFQELKINDLGFGYDPFGLEIESAVAALPVVKAKQIYKYWFRVESHGVGILQRRELTSLKPRRFSPPQ
jgi:hypothetical protein